MNEVRYSSTLLYYDGLQLFEARDAIGGHYLAMLVDQSIDVDQYLVVGVSPEKLGRFRLGEFDLRSLILDLGREAWYLTTIADDLDHTLRLAPQSDPLQDSSLLPDEGFFLHSHPTTDDVLREARRRRNLIVEIATDPPESLAGHRIRMETLGDLLGRVQQLAKHAYRAALSSIAPAKRKTAVREGYLMDVVVPAAPGSFKVILEASIIPETTLNLFGESQLTYALQRMDELFEFASDPDQSVPIVQRHRGRVATAYLGLLKYLVDRDTGLRYAWAEPTSDRPRHRAISKTDARSLVDAFSVVSGIGSEPVTVVGRFAKFNRRTGDWGLVVGEKEQYSGKVKDDGPSLDGLKVGEMYRFYCTEETVEADRTGRQRRTLYLNEHEPV